VSERYELCVIGAGTAGFAAAEAARALGRTVLVIAEPGDLGGTCILRGCMPAKTLLSSTERLGDVEAASELGVRATDAAIDLPAIVRRKRELVDYFAEDRVHDLAAYPLLRGRARFVAPGAIDVAGRRITADRFVIATGSVVIAPPIAGLAECGYFTSDGALEMTGAPASLVVLGGGPVGCEFAQYFARLGTRVTLVQSEATLLRNEDADLSEVVCAALQRDGVEVLMQANVTRCSRSGDARLVELESEGKTMQRRVEAIMLASGRTPNTAGLDLGAAGIALEPGGGIDVDATLRSSNGIAYAAGDVLGRRCLVHVAEYAGRLAARNAFAAQPVAADFDRFESHAVYTQPQIAVAGLTEAACRARGLAIRIRRHPFRDVGKALVSNEAEGFIKMLASPDDRVVGIAIVSDDAIDLIGEAIALIDRGATTAEIAEMPHLHPTMGEIYARVAEDFTAPVSA
jgi:pyruvate/2-oxoglutarate dehydrogenase complex dihydrolipoamide dehydrogenase (E3) component